MAGCKTDFLCTLLDGLNTEVNVDELNSKNAVFQVGISPKSKELTCILCVESLWNSSLPGRLLPDQAKSPARVSELWKSLSAQSWEKKLLDRNYLWKLCQKQRKHSDRSFLLSMYVFEWRDVKYLKAFPWACQCNHQEISTTNVPFYHCLLILSNFNSLKPTFLFLPAFVTLCKFISCTSKPSTCQSKDLPGLSFLRTNTTR